MKKLKKDQLAIGSFHYAFYSFERFVESMRRFGVTNVEVSGNRGHLWVSGDGVDRAREMAGMLRGAGIGRVACLCPEQNAFPYNIAARDDRRRAASVAYMADAIRCADALGCPRVLLCPGTAYLDEDPAEGKRRSIDSISQLVEVAEKYQVKLVLETQSLDESSHVNATWQQAEIIDEVNHPCLGGMIDTVQLAMYDEGDIARAIDILGDRLWHVHLGDTKLYDRDLGRAPFRDKIVPGRESEGHVGIGCGELPLADYLSALADAGYPYNVSVEICGWSYFYDPDAYTELALNVLGDCFE